jgi:hypothetical protein
MEDTLQLQAAMEDTLRLKAAMEGMLLLKAIMDTALLIWPKNNITLPCNMEEEAIHQCKATTIHDTTVVTTVHLYMAEPVILSTAVDITDLVTPVAVTKIITGEGYNYQQM